jgi:hypothetical protein
VKLVIGHNEHTHDADVDDDVAEWKTLMYSLLLRMLLLHFLGRILAAWRRDYPLEITSLLSATPNQQLAKLNMINEHLYEYITASALGDNIVDDTALPPVPSVVATLVV